MSSVDLVAVFMLGLVGSTHCLAMCSAFVLCTSRSSRAASWLYQGGRGTAYALLGGVLALCGAGLRAQWELAAGRWMLVAAGALMVLLGLAQAGVVRLPETSGTWLGKRLSGLLRAQSPAGALGLGLFTGLLPCPLLYTALLKAAVSPSPLEGAATMAAFWTGTLPAMAGLSFLAPWMQRHGATWWPRLALVVTVLLGSLTFYHGLSSPSGTCPHCH